MEVLRYLGTATGAANSAIDGLNSAITGSVTPAKPTTSLCRNAEQESYYSLAPAAQDTSLCQRSIVDHEEKLSSIKETSSHVTTEQEFSSVKEDPSDISAEEDDDNFVDCPAADEEQEFEFFDASSAHPLVQAGLETQKTIHSNLAGQPAELFLHGLHQHSILTAQFQQSAEETIALLEARITALADDIEHTFSRLSTRKGQAKAQLETLRQQLESLKQNQDETSLNTLLDGMLAYETEFEKVSWVLLSTLAFLDASNSGFAADMAKLVPTQLLAGGPEALLNPCVVCKFKRNLTMARQTQSALINLIQQMIEKSAGAETTQQTETLLQTLNTEVLGAPGQVVDPMTAMMQVIETQPALAGQLLALRFKELEVDVDPTVRASAKFFQKMFEETPAENGSEYLKAALTQHDQSLNQVVTLLGGWVQKQYLFQQNETLKKRTAALLAEKKIITQQQYQEMVQQAEELKELAKARNFNPAPITKMALEMRKLSALPVCQAMAEGGALWHLNAMTDSNPETHLQIVTDAIHGKNNHPYADAIRKLHAYLLAAGSESTSEYQDELHKKDELLLCQREICLEQAHNHLDNTAKFQNLIMTAQSIEALRPKALLLDMMDGTSSPYDAARRLGRGILTPQSLPFAHQVKELKLMHDLTVKGYKFEDEAWDLLHYLPGTADNLWAAGEQTYTDGKQLVSKLYNMELGTFEALREITKLGNNSVNRITKDFQDILTGAAILGKNNPKLLRAVYGNLHQTLTVLGNTVGSDSTVYVWFKELHSRVGAEASAQYFIDSLDDEPVDLNKVSEEDLKALKRLVTLNRILTCGPYVPHVLNAALGTVQAQGNPVSTVWAWAKAGANIAYSNLVQKNVNAMGGKEVQAFNTVLDTLVEGPAYAAWHQQMMEQSGQILADLSCQKPLQAALTASPIFSLYPFRALAKRVKEAFNHWMEGAPGSRTELGLTLLKAAPVVAAPAAALVPVFFAANVVGLGSACILFVGSLWTAHGWAKEVVRYSGMTDVVTVVSNHIHDHFKKPEIDFQASADKLLEKTQYDQHVHIMAENHSYASLTDGFWKVWSDSCLDNGAKASRVRAKIVAQVEKDFADNTQQFKQLQQAMHALNYLKSCKPEEVNVEELKKILPAEDVPALPDTHHKIYWVQVMQERLQDEIFSAIGCDTNGKDTIPATVEELEARLKTFIINRMLGAILASECPQARDALQGQIALYQNKLVIRARDRAATCLMRTVEHAMTTIFMQRIGQYQGYKNGKINPEDFNKALGNDYQFNQQIKQYLNSVVMTVFMNAAAASNERLLRQLRAQKLDGDKAKAMLQIIK